MPITKFFLQKRIFTFIVIFIVAIIGIQSYRSLHIETTPEVQTAIVYVAIPLPGAAPEEVETLVTNPVEEKLSELDDVDTMISSCLENVSLTIVFFNEKVNAEKSFEQFKEKINEIRPLIPKEILEPIVESISFENLPMMFLGLSGKKKSQYELSVEAGHIKHELEQIRSVKNVLMVGATTKHVEIEVEPEQLKKYGVSVLRTLTENLDKINTNIPGGKVVIGAEENLVRTIGKLTSLDDLRNLVLGVVNNKPVALKNIAHTRINYPSPETHVRVMGQPGVTLGVLRKHGFGTLEVAAEVKKVLKKHKDVLILNDQSATITREMGALRLHALYGTFLVIIVLFLFLGSRVAIIVSTALPLSILMTFIGMSFQGLSIDMVSLFALVLALGMMVDNAIVVCENIYRHINIGQSPLAAALQATDEVGWPILSSTLCTLAAFMPMILVGGPIGQFTRPIPYIVTYALIASYIVALCFNPLLSASFIRKVAHRKKQHKWANWIKTKYEVLLNWALDHRIIIVITALLIFVISLCLIPFVGVELFPQMDTSKVYVDISTPAGNTIENTQKVVADIEKIFRKSGKVDRYISSAGTTGMRVEIDDRMYMGSNRARILVDLKEADITGQPHKKTIQQFRAAIEKIVPEGTEVHFMEKVLGPPIGMPIDIRISGKNMDNLYTASEKIKKALRKVGVIDVKDNFPSDIPQIVIQVNQHVAGSIGLTTRDIGGFIFLSLTGYRIGEMLINEEKLPIFLKIRKSADTTASAFDNAAFTLPDGKILRFSDLAVIRPTYGYASMEHQNGIRTVTITGNLVKGMLATRVIEQVKKDLPKMKLPENTTVFFAGETRFITSAFGDLKKALLISLILIYIVLLIEFKSTLQPLIILTCVPYALVGVVLGLLITGNSFGILSFIGVVCLTGIVVNNAIILIDYANLLRSRGISLRQSIIEAAQIRLRPIIMTKSTVILGVLPLAIAASDKTQFWKPLCWSIIWGLVVATTLTLIIIPVVYYIMENARARYYEKRKQI